MKTGWQRYKLSKGTYVHSYPLIFYQDMKQKIAILAGGFSSEWEISMESAQVVFDNLDREKYEFFSRIYLIKMPFKIQIVQFELLYFWSQNVIYPF